MTWTEDGGTGAPGAPGAGYLDWTTDRLTEKNKKKLYVHEHFFFKTDNLCAHWLNWLNCYIEGLISFFILAL